MKLTNLIKELRENSTGFPDTLTHPTFGLMKRGSPFTIKGRTYFTYESNNHVVHVDKEIATMYNHHASNKDK